MVGLNHEFARELLWREYPTDQRGSYFRQFWDVARLPRRARAPTRRHCASGCATSPSCTAGRATSALGDHDHREAQGDKEEEVVLVIRGELLKKYPTAVIYAHRAAWERTGDGGAIDRTKPRKLADLAGAGSAAARPASRRRSTRRRSTPTSTSSAST